MIVTEITTIPINYPIKYWTQSSPWGELLLASSENGICYIGFEPCVNDMKARFVSAKFQRVEHSVDLNAIDCICLIGTDFQREVWRELLNVGSGDLTTYSALAAKISRSRAVRAVGSAVGRNPISIIVPCHRVVRLDGAMGGYYWGLDTKRALLASEKQDKGDF